MFHSEETMTFANAKAWANEHDFNVINHFSPPNDTRVVLYTERDDQKKRVTLDVYDPETGEVFIEGYISFA